MSILTRTGRRIAVAGIGAAIAVTTLGTGAAQAGIPAHLPSGPTTVHPINVGDFAPTADLATVTNALQFRIKSVSSELTLNRALNVHHAIDVTVSYPGSETTQSYSKTFGNGWKYQFATNNGHRYGSQVTVTLVEHDAGNKTQTFSRTWLPIVEPLFNYTVSPLLFKLYDDCDTFGDSEIKIQYRDATGSAGNIHFNASAGDNFSFPSFAKRYVASGESANLRQPGVSWLEHDFDPFGAGDPPPPGNGFNLATHSTFSYSALTTAPGQDCRGRLQYSVIKSPVLTYGFTI
jgi:hypothetical protein